MLGQVLDGVAPGHRSGRRPPRTRSAESAGSAPRGRKPIGEPCRSPPGQSACHRGGARSTSPWSHTRHSALVTDRASTPGRTASAVGVRGRPTAESPPTGQRWWAGEDTMPVTANDVRAALATVKDPEIRRPITDLGMVDSIAVIGRGRRRPHRAADHRRLPDARHSLRRRHDRGPGGARGHRTAPDARCDDGCAARRIARLVARRGHQGDPVRPPGLADQGVRRRLRQGWGRQVHGHRQSGGIAGGDTDVRSGCSMPTSTGSRCRGCSG